MTKYLKSRHVPLHLNEPKAVGEEFNDFLLEIEEAGTLLNAFRESKGFSEEELGQHVGIDTETIILMESGEQPIPFILAKKFGKIFEADYHLFL
jgi:DNA-binding XRE family transcriptional regulator